MPKSRPPSRPMATAASSSGTDNQGRDLLSAMMYGARVSIAIGGGAVLLAASIGVFLGLIAGYFGGKVDALIMRIGDVILSFPTILLALLVSGIARALFPQAATAEWAPLILICAIAIHEWVQYARTVRAATMVETAKDYVKAVKVIGLPSRRIMLRHILPNVMGPVLVIATINLAAAVLTEATLSFLGVGMPPTYPSLGTLIRIGNEFVFSGIWWIALFPGPHPRAARAGGERRGRLAARPVQSQIAGETMSHRQPPVLEIDNLRVEYPLANGGLFTAVENASLTIQPGEIHALVGESGAGKTTIGNAVMGLLEKPGRIASGSIHIGGKLLDPTSGSADGVVLGRDVGAVFQDPMTSLNPLFTVESQLTETLRAHLKMDKAAARLRALELMKSVGHSRARAPSQGLSAPIVRRAAAARRHRGRPVVRSDPRRRRRADHRARRVGAGADPQAPARSRRHARHRHPARNPQHGRRGADRRPRHHHASRPGRGKRTDGRGPAQTESRLREGAHRRRAAHRHAARPLPRRRRRGQGPRRRCARSHSRQGVSRRHDGGRNGNSVRREPLRRLRHERPDPRLEGTPFPRRRQCELQGAQRRGVRPRRRIRLRQDDDRQRRGGARETHIGPRSLPGQTRCGRRRRSAASARCGRRSR